MNEWFLWTTNRRRTDESREHGRTSLSRRPFHRSGHAFDEEPVLVYIQPLCKSWVSVCRTWLGKNRRNGIGTSSGLDKWIVCKPVCRNRFELPYREDIMRYRTKL